jgi:hypothetical protein
MSALLHRMAKMRLNNRIQKPPAINPVMFSGMAIKASTCSNNLIIISTKYGLQSPARAITRHQALPLHRQAQPLRQQ